MAAGHFVCFGDTCRAGNEFCDDLSRFCIGCSTPPWNKRCFTSKHIDNCTDYCRALELRNRPINEPEVSRYPPWLIAVTVALLLACITLLVIIVNRRRTVVQKYLVRIKKAVLSCFADHNEITTPRTEQTVNDADEEAAMIEPPAPGDQHPVQATPDGATEHPSNDYPTFGPTALNNHEETKLM